MSIVDFSTGEDLDLPDISEIYNKLEKMFPNQKKEMKAILTVLYKNMALVNLKRTRNLNLLTLKENVLILSSDFGCAKDCLKVIADGLEVPIYFLCAGCLLGEDYNRYLMEALDNLIVNRKGRILVLEDLDLLQYYTKDDLNISREREKLASSVLKQFLSSSYWNVEKNGELSDRYIGDMSIVGIGNINGVVKKSFSRVIGFYNKILSFDGIKALVQNSQLPEDYLTLLKELGIDLVVEPSFTSYIAQKVNSRWCYDNLGNSIASCINEIVDDALLELFISGNQDLETSIPSKKYDELHLKEPDSESKQKPYQLVKKKN